MNPRLNQTARLSALLPLLLAAAISLSVVYAVVPSTTRTSFDPLLASIERLTVSSDQLRSDAEHLKTGLDGFQQQYSAVAGKDAESTVAIIKAQINNGQIPLHLPDGSRIAKAKVQVWGDSSDGRMVFVPYAGSVVAPSGATIQLSASGAITEISEAVYQSQTKDSGTLSVWINGTLKKDVLIDASGAEHELVTSRGGSTTSGGATTNAVTPSSWWDDFTYCMSNIMSVPSWVLNGIGIACGLICLASAGTGCFACLAASATFFSGSVGYCIGWASGG